ncbi:Nif3-like dinuclear metal center hexameric protein [Fibrella arboris]|uniref:Nif3-like dinuclear metal center hexameric protein n=1 Tax=Fibrella arboris TaxID=3242486 RepID=UPI0035203297
MNEQLPQLTDLAQFLEGEFQASRYPKNEQGGIYTPSDRAIHRLGVTLEPEADTGNWVRSNRLDALWMHRPWQLDLKSLPVDVGVVTHHLPFDESLTMGYNRPLATTLGLLSLDELGYKQQADESGILLPKRAIGMIGNVPERTHDEWINLINAQFRGYDRVEAGANRSYKRVAVVGAMTDTLIREAHAHGVELYLTGAYRKAAQSAIAETGMSVMAIGHQRTEEWGLRALGNRVQERWPALEVVLVNRSLPSCLPY